MTYTNSDYTNLDYTNSDYTNLDCATSGWIKLIPFFVFHTVLDNRLTIPQGTTKHTNESLAQKRTLKATAVAHGPHAFACKWAADKGPRKDTTTCNGSKGKSHGEPLNVETKVGGRAP